MLLDKMVFLLTIILSHVTCVVSKRVLIRTLEAVVMFLVTDYGASERK